FPDEHVTKVRYNFDAFKRQNWSLEHIFPQTPEGKGQILSELQKQSIRDLIGETDEEIDRILELPSRTEEERKVYEDALSKSGYIHNIGNICLLSSSDNSALGNLFFQGKRDEVMRRIQSGSFVPKHTFDVFSKMISGVGGDLSQWSSADIKAHAVYIEEVLEKRMETES
ncbi:MAG: HNH endonuclease family protein, partial [Candidatus Pacearchaeota archaeon]|nr:HNH endonuclease family protein [Candidatus Pacearchaeota archaeon]